jgi:hypothetical protein
MLPTNSYFNLSQIIFSQAYHKVNSNTLYLTYQGIIKHKSYTFKILQFKTGMTATQEYSLSIQAQ